MNGNQTNESFSCLLSFSFVSLYNILKLFFDTFSLLDLAIVLTLAEAGTKT